MARTPKQEPQPRRWYGGMKPVGRPKHETEPRIDPPPKVPKKKPKITKLPKPPQKGTGEESVE